MGFDKMTGFFILFAVLGRIAWEDCRDRIIPNGELAFLFVVRGFFLVPACLAAGGVGELLDCVAGFLLGGGVFFLCYLAFRGGVGAGDVKLFAVLGWWLGGGRILFAVFLAMVLALSWPVFAAVFREERRGIPLAPFAWLGVLGALFWNR